MKKVSPWKRHGKLHVMLLIHCVQFKRILRTVCMQVFYPLCVDDNTDVWLCAAKYGALGVLQELKNRNISGHNYYVIYEAAGNGHLETLKWLVQENLGKCTS